MANPSVEGIGRFLFLILCLVGESARRETEADDEGYAARGTGLQKITTVYNGNIRHGTTSGCVLVSAIVSKSGGGLGLACLHGCGAMDGLADALVGAAAADVAAHSIVDIGVGGLGFFESSATADMICPDWQ